MTGFTILFNDFLVETDADYVNRQCDGYHEIDARLMAFEADSSKTKMVWDGDRPIGFMIYNCIYDCVLVVRAIYFKPEYRLKCLMRQVVFSVSKDIKRIFSKTHLGNEPKEIRGETPKRKQIFKDKKSIVWEKIIGDLHG